MTTTVQQAKAESLRYWALHLGMNMDAWEGVPLPVQEEVFWLTWHTAILGAETMFEVPDPADKVRLVEAVDTGINAYEPGTEGVLVRHHQGDVYLIRLDSGQLLLLQSSKFEVFSPFDDAETEREEA